MSILLFKPNSNSSISESSELKSENFFFSFDLVFLSDILAIAADLFGKPVSETVVVGEVTTGTVLGVGVVVVAVVTGVGFVVLVVEDEAKKSSVSLVGSAGAAVLDARVLDVGALLAVFLGRL